MSNIMDQLRNSALDGVLAPFAGAFDYFARPWMKESWGGPLNGQAFRRLIVDAVIKVCEVKVIIETGAFRGTTTDYFARAHGVDRVVTVEAKGRFYWYTKLRMRSQPAVEVVKGDSRALLSQLANQPGLTDMPTLFYLDAHWEQDLPLGEEVALGAAHWKNWVAVIDDFSVPGDRGYGFDAYGPDSTLDAEYLRKRVAGLQFFYPRLESALETGLKRGCVAVTSVPAVAQRLACLTSLLTPG